MHYVVLVVPLLLSAIHTSNARKLTKSLSLISFVRILLISHMQDQCSRHTKRQVNYTVNSDSAVRISS